MQLLLFLAGFLRQTLRLIIFIRQKYDLAKVDYQLSAANLGTLFKAALPPLSLTSYVCVLVTGHRPTFSSCLSNEEEQALNYFPKRISRARLTANWEIVITNSFGGLISSYYWARG
jgi:hypothetical protein